MCGRICLLAVVAKLSVLFLPCNKMFAFPGQVALCRSLYFALLGSVMPGYGVPEVVRCWFFSERFAVDFWEL